MMMDLQVMRVRIDHVALFSLAAALSLLWGPEPVHSQQPAPADDESESSSKPKERSPESSDSEPTDSATIPSASDERSDKSEAVSGEADQLRHDDAVEFAVRDNHDVEISRKETEIAERDVSLGNADFLPTLEAVASQNHLFGGPGMFGQNQIFTRTSLGLQATWPLFRGFGRFSTYDRLKATRSVKELEEEARIEETIVDASTAYYDAVRQRRLLEAFRETRELSAERVEIAESRHAAGTGSKVDVNLAKVEFYRDRSAVAEQKVALSEAKTELNRIMGRKAEHQFRVEDELEVGRKLSRREVRRRALSNNRRLLAAERRVDVTSERLDEVQAERWPNANLTLGYTYTEFHGGLAPEFTVAPGLEYGLSLVIPLFDGFNVQRRIRNAHTERTISDISVRREETRIRRDLRDAHESFRRHLERIEYANESIELAEENVDIALTELRAGTITQVELRQVQLNLQDARTRLIDAKYNAKWAELRLRRLTGELYDEYL